MQMNKIADKNNATNGTMVDFWIKKRTQLMNGTQ
jgi:hypothetical protein